MSRKAKSRIGIDPFAEADEIKTVEAAVSESKQEQRQLHLEGAVDIRKVSDLKEALQASLAWEPPIAIDATQVEKMDGAALQLLVTYVAELKQRGLGFEWQGASAAMRESARLLGLEGHLQLPAA